MAVKPVEYRLSFYEPDSERECIDFDAATPFQAVHVGDEVTGVTWEGSANPRKEPSPIAVVTKVVRQLGEVGGKIYDITLAYTKSLPGK